MPHPGNWLREKQQAVGGQLNLCVSGRHGHRFGSIRHVCWIQKNAFLIHAFLAFHSWYSFYPEPDSIQTVFPFLQSHWFCGFLGQEAYPSKCKLSNIQDSPVLWIPTASGKQSSLGGLQELIALGRHSFLPLQIPWVDPQQYSRSITVSPFLSSQVPYQVLRRPLKAIII